MFAIPTQRQLGFRAPPDIAQALRLQVSCRQVSDQQRHTARPILAAVYFVTIRLATIKNPLAMSTPSITLDAEGNLHLGPRIIPIPKHISPEAQQWLAMPRKARRSAGNCDASRTSTWVRGKSPLTAPLDAFKLDASSVRDILINPGDLAMAMTVIALGHNFKRVTQGAKAAENYYVTQGTETLAVAMPKPPAPRYENSPVGR